VVVVTVAADVAAGGLAALIEAVSQSLEAQHEVVNHRAVLVGEA
jgi:hypothetical protein